jgi:hypothetical protein
LILDELKAVRYRVEGTAIVQSTHGNPAVAALLKKLAIPAPKRILALER